MKRFGNSCTELWVAVVCESTSEQLDLNILTHMHLCVGEVTAGNMFSISLYVFEDNVNETTNDFVSTILIECQTASNPSLK